MKAKPTKSVQPKKSKPPTTPDRVAGKLFDRVASILDEARSSVVRAVNSRMVLAYWLMARRCLIGFPLCLPATTGRDSPQPISGVFACFIAHTRTELLQFSTQRVLN